MVARLTALIAAFLAALISNLVGVLTFFNPIARGDTTSVSAHPAVGLLVYVSLCVILFDWAAKQIGNAYKAAFILAASQGVLIVDLTFRGQRGLVTAAAGIFLLAITWSIVAYLYSKISSEKTSDDD